MLNYNFRTGHNGEALIQDDQANYVDFWFRAGFNDSHPSVPWSYTLNGNREGWRSFQLRAGGEYHKVTSLYVPVGQYVTFHLGDTSNLDIGGPADFEIFVRRSTTIGGTYIQVGNEIKEAVPYVNDNGLWRVAKPMIKYQGTWQITN